MITFQQALDQVDESIRRGTIKLSMLRGLWVYYYKYDSVQEPHGPFDSAYEAKHFLARRIKTEVDRIADWEGRNHLRIRGETSTPD